jgi:putative hydrolase of the HAD superfamily
MSISMFDPNEDVPMKPCAVLFDAAETLFTTRGSIGEIYAGIARQYGSNADPESIQRAFVRHFRGAGPTTIQNEKEFWKDVVYRVFNETGMVRDFDEFFEKVYDNFRDSQGWMLFPETLDVLKQLQGAGIKLGIISNFDSRIYSVLDSLRIRHFFDAVTISSEAGFPKPDPRIFQTAVDALGCPASDVLLIGDNPQEDVEAAMRAGLNAVLIDRKQRYSAQTHLRRISSLAEVLAEVTS